jgi:hypothetical protein
LSLLVPPPSIGGDKGVAVVEALLQAYPEAVSVTGSKQRTPLEKALVRVENKFDNTTKLSASDPLVALLKAGG